MERVARSSGAAGAAVPPDAVARASEPRQRSPWARLVSWLAASLLLVLCVRNIDGPAAWARLQEVRPQWLALAVACNLGILLLWGGLWRMLLPATEKAPRVRMFEVVALTAMTMNTVPLWLGHVSGVAFLARHGRVSGGAALSVLATHTVLEGLAKVATLALAVALVPLPSWMQRGALAVAAGAFVLTTGLVALARIRAADRTDPLVPGSSGQSPLPQRLRAGAGLGAAIRRLPGAIRQWARHLEALRSGRSFASGVVLLLGMKAAEGAAILCVQRGFGVELPLTSVPVVLAAVMLAGMIPVAPANMGTYEAGVFLVYQQLGLTPDAALSLALVQHLCLLAALVGTGYAVVLVGPSRESGASRSPSRPARLLRALAIWFCLLGFGLAVGLLALVRNLRPGGAGNRWTGMRADEREIAEHLRRSEKAPARTGSARVLFLGLLLLPTAGMARAAPTLAQASAEMTQHEHTRVPSAPEEPPPLRIRHDAAAHELIAELGPITLPAGMEPIVTRDPISIFASLPTSGWLQGYRIEVIDAHGQPIPRVVLHHINLMLPGRRELFSPIMQRIASAAADTPPVTLPWFLGVPASEGDTLLISTMLWNPTGDTYDRVYVRVHIPFAPAGAWFRPLRVFPFHMDVMPPTGSRSYDLPPGRSEKSWEARPAVSGRILGAGGHLHRYGIALRLEDVSAGKLLWQTTPVLDQHGDVAAMPIQKFIWPPVGLRVSADHTYRLTAVYENPTGDTIQDGAMGEIGGIIVPAGRESWPDIDRRGAAYFEDRLMVIEGLTAQSAMDGGRNSHETSSRAGPEPASHSASPRPRRR